MLKWNIELIEVLQKHHALLLSPIVFIIKHA